VALAGVIVLLLLVWAVLPGGGDDRPRDSAAAAGSPSPTDPVSAPTGLTATAPSGDPGPAGDGNGVGGAAATTTPVTTTPAPTTPVPTTPAPTVRPPTACPDTAIQVTVSPRAKAYRVGQQPVFDLRVRNVSALACIRDLGAGQQEIVVYRGSQRLWSSNDCYPSTEKSPQLLRPGAQETSSVTWSGLGSRPRCAGQRVQVGAGSYTVVARVGTAVTRRTPFTLR
jgi:hypothetical protein